MKLVCFLFVSIITYGCASLPEKSGLAYPPERLYQAKCASCHRLYPVGLYAYEELLNYTHKYGRGLTVDERSRLLGYFKANAKQK